MMSLIFIAVDIRARNTAASTAKRDQRRINVALLLLFPLLLFAPFWLYKMHTSSDKCKNNQRIKGEMKAATLPKVNPRKRASSA
jgi:hypothetical protein